MKTLLWLDDARNPFKDNWISNYAIRYENENIVWVKNYNEYVDYITTNNMPDMIAFDHDLGEAVDKNGFDCAKWLVEYCMDNNIKLPRWTIQSANPVGKENINKLLINYKKYE